MKSARRHLLMIEECEEAANYEASERRYSGRWEWNTALASEHAKFSQAVFATPQRQQHDPGNPGPGGAAG
jgi:hypothetical protein